MTPLSDHTNSFKSNEDLFEGLSKLVQANFTTKDPVLFSAVFIN